MTIDRVRVHWSGFLGGPGISTYYFTAAVTHQGALQEWLVATAAYLPPNVTLRAEDSGDTINPATGALTGGWSGTTTAAVTGGGSGAYSAPTGILVTWGTGTIVDGHRVKGRTFLVPASDENYQSDGQIVIARKAALEVSGFNLSASAGTDFVIWHRPRAAAPGFTDRKGKVHPAITARDGSAAPITTCVVASKPAVLTNRRD